MSNESDSRQLALDLQKIPSAMFKRKWQRQFAREAPGMLDKWCRVYPILVELMEVSSEFRFLGERPKGEA
jgi:hypothetical protein